MSAKFARTVNAMNNYLVTGPRTDEVLSLPCTTGWGDDGVMGWLDAIGARVCLLGIPDDRFGWSLVHRAEEIQRVPYRYYKRFAGDLYRQGERIGECVDVLYVTPRGVAVGDDYTLLNKELRDRGAELRSGNPLLALRSARADDVVTIAVELLKKDPFVFVPNRDAVQRWIAEMMDAEIAAIAPDERFPQVSLDD